MIDLANSKLLDILPPNLRNDPDIIAASKAIDKEFSSVVNSIKNVLTVANIKNSSSEIIDHIAIESHADFYDFNLDLDVRRKLAEKSIELHMRKGTSYAVEQIIQNCFGDGFVEEWFEYGGQPHHFKVITTNSSVTSELANQFNMAVNSVKRLSSVLEQIIIDLSAELDIYYAGVVHTGDNLTIRQVV